MGNPWTDIVTKVEKNNPNISFKQILVKAKNLYNTSNSISLIKQKTQRKNKKTQRKKKKQKQKIKKQKEKIKKHKEKIKKTQIKVR